MAANMNSILAPYVVDVSIFMRSICGRGGMIHWMNVSIGNALSHIHLYFKKRRELFVAVAWYIVSSSTKGHALSLYHEGEPLI